MHRVQERLEQFCSELPGLKIIDSGAVSHVQLSRMLDPHEEDGKLPS